jgi:glycosyltransferase involved in cell wall biosynthesis
LKERIIAEIGSLGLRAAVDLRGFRQYDEMPQLFEAADVFIHPSTYEEWGLVVNEAMASELPVLVSRQTGSAEDLVVEGVNGFCFDAFSEDDILNKMVKISALSNAELTSMGRASREIVGHFDPPLFAKNVVELVGKYGKGFSANEKRWLSVAIARAVGIIQRQ